MPSEPHAAPDSSLWGTSEGLLEGGQRLVGGLHKQWRHGISQLLGGGDEEEEETGSSRRPSSREDDGLHIQLTRSCSAWSAGHLTEHSIANAYIAAITGAEHFVYIENQFFITATSDKQRPVANKIGRAIVDRIVRAHEAGDDFGMIVCIPAVPGFAGDLQGDGALGTRAIMEFQYDSISRGGHSIYEELRAAGVDEPERYLRFYNLRNYGRINTAPLMGRVERASGVSYEDARREFDDAVESGYDGYSRQETHGRLGDKYHRYQAAAEAAPNDPTADTVSPCYMADGPALADVPWSGDDAEAERNAYVSEELYIHTKVLIADDRLVICGSANLNDRSQLGSHDSEIAVVIEDPNHPVRSSMNGKPYTVGAFAASLRRQLFRKHIGLLPDQQCDKPTDNVSSLAEGGGCLVNHAHAHAHTLSLKSQY